MILSDEYTTTRKFQIIYIVLLIAAMGFRLWAGKGPELPENYQDSPYYAAILLQQLSVTFTIVMLPFLVARLICKWTSKKTPD